MNNFIFAETKPNNMNTIRTNIWNLEVGDIITFTNKVNYKVVRVVKRVEDKSWYDNGRNSWNTLNRYSQYPDFKIIKPKTK